MGDVASAGLASSSSSQQDSSAPKCSLSFSDALLPKSRWDSIQKSDKVLELVAGTIQSRLTLYDIVLDSRKVHGKTEVATAIAQILQEADHEETKNKSISPATILSWIKVCVAEGNAEMTRREREKAAGRSDGVEVKAYVTVWADLLELNLRNKASASKTYKGKRYTEPPDELKGKVFLQKDDGAAVQRTDDRAIALAVQDKAVKVVAERKRNYKAKLNSGVDNETSDSESPVQKKPYLHPTKLSSEHPGLQDHLGTHVQHQLQEDTKYTTWKERQIAIEERRITMEEKAQRIAHFKELFNMRAMATNNADRAMLTSMLAEFAPQEPPQMPQPFQLQPFHSPRSSEPSSNTSTPSSRTSHT